MARGGLDGPRKPGWPEEAWMAQEGLDSRGGLDGRGLDGLDSRGGLDGRGLDGQQQ